jgi:sugar phosphate isomerase/epimerase
MATSTKLGLDLFSLRSQNWSAFQLLDYSAKLGMQVAHFSEPRFLGSLDEPHLDQVKAHAVSLGLELEVGFGSICSSSQRFALEDGTAEEQLRRMFQVAHRLGSTIVRCYLGSSKDREGPIPLEEHIENTVRACKAVRSEALDLGLKIAVENHAGDLQSQQLRMLIEEAGPDYVGALYDSGNAAWTLEDPLHALETLAPYVVTSGIRDSAIWEVDSGAAVQWVAMGQGNVEIARIAERYAELCPGKVFSLEIINTRSPRVFPYWSEDFWEHYRDVPASVFAGFLRRARSGRPYDGVPRGPSGTASGSAEFKQFLVEQERRDVEQAVAYCKTELGLGKG